MRDKICDFEGHAWDTFCESHPDMRVVQSCLENVSPFRFWSISRFSQSNACSGEAHRQFFALTVVYHGSRILMVPFVLFVKRILKV